MYTELKQAGEKFPLKFLALFGSRASGTHSEESDWDLAYCPHRPLTAEEDIEVFNSLCKAVGTEQVDLVDVTKTQNLLLRYRIATQGLALLGEPEFRRWSRDAWFEYHDFSHVIKDEREVLKRRLERMST